MASNEPGVEIPFEFDTQDSVATVEKLAAKLLDLEGSVNKLTEATKKQTVVTKESATSFGIVAGAVAGITQVLTEKAIHSVEQLVGGLEAATAFGSKFQNMSLQFNTSAESLQKLAAIGKPVGVGVEQIARSLNIVERTLGTNQKAFQKWGVDVQKLAGADAAGKFNILIDKIRSINDPAKQAAASFDLLKDRSGAFLKIARNGDIDAITKDFDEFGLAVKNNAVGALDALGNQKELIGDIFTAMKTNFLGAIASSGAFQEAIRIVTEFLGKLSKFVQDNADTIRKWVDVAILVAADALVFIAKNVVPAVIDALTVLALGLFGVKKVVDLAAASIEFLFKVATKPSNLGAAFDALKVRVSEIGKEAAEGVGKIVEANASVQDTAGKAAAGLEGLRDRLDKAAHSGKSYAVELKKSSEAFNPEQTEAGLKAINKQLEDQLALFAKVQALEKLGTTFAGNEEKQVQSARQAVASADKELEIRRQILENERKILELKGADTKTIAVQLDTLQKTHDINVQIGQLQEEQAHKAASDAAEVERLNNTKKIFDLTQQLNAAQNDGLTGMKALAFSQQQQLDALVEEVAVQAAILEIEIQRQAAEGNDTSEAQRKLDQLLIEYGIRKKILTTTQEHAKALAKAQEQGKIVSAALAAAAQAANLLAGTKWGDFVGGLVAGAQAAFELGQNLKEAIAKAGGFSKLDIASKLQAVGSGLQVANNIFQKNKQELSGAKGAANGAAQGAAFGAAFGPYGIAIGAIAGGLIGFFSGQKFRKIAKDAGSVLGAGLSKETVAKIQADSKKLGIAIKDAALLNISAAMKDTGKSASSFAGQIGDLMKAIAKGSVPAAEGIAALGESFNAVADEALKAGRIGDRVMTGLIKQARALKIESPDIKAFVSGQLEASTAGIAKFVDSLKGLTGEAVAKLGKDAGIIFGANFAALVEEKGIVGAVDAMKDSFASLKETLEKSLGADEAAAIVAPFAAAFNTLGDEKLRPIFEGIDGITQAMKGLANAGFLTTDQFAAMQRATSTLFDEAIAGGADLKTSLTAIAPAIQTAITASEQFGVPLDANTQRLKDLAEQNGITFKTDPQQAMLDVLVEIAKVLGADIPESARKAQRAIENMGDSATGAVGKAADIATGGGVTGGTSGRKTVVANVSVDLGINENPLANAQTAAEMRRATVNWTAEAIQDRIPGIVAAIEAAA